MEFLEVIQENWFEIVSAVGTIIGVFFATKRKRTPAEREQIQKEKNQKEAEKLTKKASKHLDQAKAEFEKANELKKENSTNA